MTLSGGESLTKEPTKNALNTVSPGGPPAVRIAKTGYTGEPLGYEVYVRQRGRGVAVEPSGGAGRASLRAWAPGIPCGWRRSFPLYGHEMGIAPDGSEIPIFAVPLAKFAVSFSAAEGRFHRPGGPGNVSTEAIQAPS